MTEVAAAAKANKPEVLENLPLTERPNCVFCGLPVPQGQSPVAKVKAYAGVKRFLGTDSKGNAQHYLKPGWAYEAPICPSCGEKEKRKIAGQRPLFLLVALLLLAALGLFVYYVGGYILDGLRSARGINMGLALACAVGLAVLRFGLALLVLSLEKVFSKPDRMLGKRGYKRFESWVLADVKSKAPKEITPDQLFAVDQEDFVNLQATNRDALAKSGKKEEELAS